jgi:hypothetical protein
MKMSFKLWTQFSKSFNRRMNAENDFFFLFKQVQRQHNCRITRNMGARNLINISFRDSLRFCTIMRRRKQKKKKKGGGGKGFDSK